jgi:uncharacterized protein (DUF983 family)
MGSRGLGQAEVVSQFYQLAKMDAVATTRGAWLTLEDILGQRCPRCRLGTMFHRSIFRGWPKMHLRCPVCDLLFAREPGYFLGAMYISYAVGLGMVAVFSVAVWAVTAWALTKDVIVAVVLFLPMAPAITLLSRVLWIYLDQTVDPE